MDLSRQAFIWQEMCGHSYSNIGILSIKEDDDSKNNKWHIKAKLKFKWDWNVGFKLPSSLEEKVKITEIEIEKRKWWTRLQVVWITLEWIGDK